MIEKINGQIIDTQMKIGSNEFNSFETKVYNIATWIDMLETKIMHVFSKNELLLY